MISQITEQILKFLNESTGLSSLHPDDEPLIVFSKFVTQNRNLVNLAKELINIIRLKKEQIKALKIAKAKLEKQNEALQKRVETLEKEATETQERLTKADIANRKLKQSEREKGKSYDRELQVHAQLGAFQAVFDSQYKRIKDLEAKLARRAARERDSRSRFMDRFRSK